MNGRWIHSGTSAAVVLALATVCAAQDHGAGLVGRWESEVRSISGLGTTLQFRDDGVLSITSSAMADSTYRLRGNRLVMSFVDPVTSEESKIKLDVEIGADFMNQSDPETGEHTRLERVPSALTGAQSVVGILSFSDSSNRRAFQIYTADERMHLRVPISTSRGTYALSGDRLTMAMNGRPPSVVQFEIDGEQLRLQSVDGSVQLYARVDW